MSSDLIFVSGSGDFAVEPRGLLKFKRKLELPEVKHGQTLLLVDSSGNIMKASSLTPALERAGSFKSWLTIDSNPKRLTFSFDEVIATDVAVFSVVIHIRVVADMEHIENIAQISAQDYQLQLLGECRRTVLRLAEADGNGERVGRSNDIMTTRQVIERRLGPLTASSLEGSEPKGLKATIADYEVTADSQTGTYASSVRELKRDRVLIAERGENSLEQTRVDLNRRKQIRKELEPYLTNGALALLETVYDDPSPKNIAAALEKTEAREKDRLDRFVNLVGEAMRNKVFVDEEGFTDFARNSWLSMSSRGLDDSSKAKGIPAAPGDLPGEVAADPSDDADFR